MRIAGIVIFLTALAGCTWVELAEQGEAVVLVSSMADTCERVGSTTSITKADIASIGRSSKKVNLELVTLARNAAVRMGGDTIIAESDVADSGEQAFGIFLCRD